jgi:two-component system, sensor histidine kinase and response regulator
MKSSSAKVNTEIAGEKASSFLAELAHELRSPLGGLDALTELLARTGLSADQARLVEGLRAASAHLRSVASAVINDEAPERRKFDILDEAFDLAHLVDAVGIAAEARAQVKGLSFTLTRPQPLPRPLMGDVRRVRQMLENLIDNAVKVTSEGSVSLALEHVDTRGAFVGLRFVITDTGPGFDKATQEKLFKPYGRIEGSAPGTGLGLNIVRKFALMMGGEAGCSSEPGQGASFWFTLRLKQAEVCTSLAEAACPALIPVTSRLPVLVVDDNATNRMILSAILEHFGYACIEAESGETALSMLSERAVAAVMMDQTLPGISGVETVKAIRQMTGAVSSIPVIPVSGRVSQADRDAFAAAGANGFVEKPVSARAIMEALQLIEPQEKDLETAKKRTAA